MSTSIPQEKALSPTGVGKTTPPMANKKFETSPNEKGQHWIRNFLQKIHDEETMKEIEQMNSEKNEMDPTAGSKKGK